MPSCATTTAITSPSPKRKKEEQSRVCGFVFLNVLNVKYHANLVVDGIFGKATKAAIQPCKRGMYGAYPSILQAFLICHGYDTGGFDGDFGARTESAVKTFQTVKGLPATGIADKNTFEKLAE